MYEFGCGVEHGKMKAARAASGLDMREMAVKCGMSTALINILENGGVTLPAFALAVGRAYGLGAKDIAALACRATLERELREGGRDAKRLVRLVKRESGGNAGLNCVRPSSNSASGGTSDEYDSAATLPATEYLNADGTRYRVISRQRNPRSSGETPLTGAEMVYALYYKSGVAKQPYWKRIYRTELYDDRNEAQAELDNMAIRCGWEPVPA